MRTSQALLTCICLAAPLLAQNYSTIPAGHLATEGANYGLYFGSRSSMRAQILNSDHNGKVRVFTEASARLDGGRSASQFFARTWTNVTLTVGEGSYANASSNFAQNLAANTQTVFNQKMTWPAVTATTPRPSPWAAQVNFPFSAVWVYTGKQDLVLDFTFVGGVLANNAAWTTYRYYYLDGLLSQTSVGGSSVNMGTNNCTNPAHTSGPFCVPVFRTYAKNTGSATTSDKFEFYWWLYRYPASTPTAFGVSFSGSTGGVNIGNPCNNYYLGYGLLFVMFGTTPTSNTGSFMFPNPRLYAKYDAAAVGIRIYTQAAYTHPTRKRFELTRGGYMNVGKQPVPIPGTKWHWATSATATSASINQTYMPLLRVKH
ncbi:MAG: hypothetical protein ACYTGW_21620 [Planctomycetota bacterium]|jgi:hypothetical protein